MLKYFYVKGRGPVRDRLPERSKEKRFKRFDKLLSWLHIFFVGFAAALIIYLFFSFKHLLRSKLYHAHNKKSKHYVIFTKNKWTR